MKKQFLFVFATFFFIACNQSNKSPDISTIKIDLKVERFENDFFKLDTLNLNQSINSLKLKYPVFSKDFFYNILGTSDTYIANDIPAFINSYYSIFVNSQIPLGNLDAAIKEIKNGFKYVHYYFPDYKLPKKLISFIGPINSFGSIITTDAIAIGLQLYLGKNHPIYNSPQGQALYPSYISSRFEPEYIPINALKNIIDDMYPDQSLGKPLIAQMIEKGKRLYLLDHFLPQLSNTLKTGYNQSQLDACYSKEKDIWSMFIVNDFLYKTDPQLTRDYVNDGPTTQTLGEGSPGNIGQFIGWQIVKKWMDKNGKNTLKDLMAKDPVNLFNESKYKPF